MAIRCGHCKEYHDSIADVRRCAGQGGPVAVLTRPAPSPRPTTQRRDALASQLPDIARVHYAVEVIDFEKSPQPFYEFYQIDKPQEGNWKGYTFLRRQAGDEFFKVSLPKTISVYEAILTDPEKAIAAYGHEIGRCGICNRTLTDPQSIALGIGPICAERL